MEEAQTLAEQNGLTLPSNISSLRRDELRIVLLVRANEYRLCAWDIYRDLYIVDLQALASLKVEEIEKIKEERAIEKATECLLLEVKHERNLYQSERSISAT